MAVVGMHVLLKKTLMTGVVLKAADKKDFFVVYAWDTDQKKYTKVTEHHLNMEAVTIPDILRHVNMDDKKDRERLFDHLTDLALDTGDKKWFDEIQVDRKKYRFPIQESEAEQNRVKPGQMVVDNNGKNSGVVLYAMKYRPGYFMVRTWSALAKDYIELPRAAHQLKVLKVPAWNQDVNTSDAVAKEDIRLHSMELAAITEDMKWMEQLTKKERQESDGA